MDLIEVATVLAGIIAVETTILTETRTEALTEAGRTTPEFRRLPIAIQKRPKALRIVRLRRKKPQHLVKVSLDLRHRVFKSVSNLKYLIKIN